MKWPVEKGNCQCPNPVQSKPQEVIKFAILQSDLIIQNQQDWVGLLVQRMVRKPNAKPSIMTLSFLYVFRAYHLTSPSRHWLRITNLFPPQ